MKRQITLLGALTAICLLVGATSGCNLKNLPGKTSDTQQRAANQNSSTQTGKMDTYAIPAGYEKFFPASLGNNKREYSFNQGEKSEYPEQDPYVERVGFFYGSGRPYDLAVQKYASEAEAKAQLDKRVSKAVPTDEYLKKIKFPKCFREGEGDKETAQDTAEQKAFHPPEELVKRIPAGGGEAVVIRPPRTWKADCEGTTNEVDNEENILWNQGIYLFDLHVSTPIGDPHKILFGEGEALFKDYLAATGQ